MSLNKPVLTNNERHWGWHARTRTLPAESQPPPAIQERVLVKLAAFWGFVVVLECIGQEVAATLRSSHERRQRIINERDFERLLASDPHFARDLGISSKQRLAEMH
jgi:hypothetical protein